MAPAEAASVPDPERPHDAGGAAEWTLPKLSVDVDGDWYDDGVQVTHPGLLANLRANLRRDAAGYYLQTRVRVPVAVEDVPLVVVRFERRGERLFAVLNDGSETEIDPTTLRIGRRDVPYCAVEGRAFEARFSRAAAFQLLGMAHYDERRGRGVLRLGPREIELRRGA